VYSEPVEHCDVCAWWAKCNRRRRDDDHLSLAAGIGRGHRKLLCEAGVSTLEALGQLDLPMLGRPNKLPQETPSNAYSTRRGFSSRRAVPRRVMSCCRSSPGVGCLACGRRLRGPILVRALAPSFAHARKTLKETPRLGSRADRAGSGR
jgi:hypothetical protein